jgi:uncharacterized protein (TIGR02328 family)
MLEMQRRGYNPESCWFDPGYRGKSAPPFRPDFDVIRKLGEEKDKGLVVYPEHNEDYLVECLLNLRGKGIDFLVP